MAGIADSPSSPQMAWPPGNVEVQFENKTSVWAWHITVEREPLVFLFIIILVFAKKLFWFPIPHPFKNHLGLEGDSSGAVLGAEFSLYVFFPRHLLYLSLLIRKYYFIYFSFSIIFYHFFFVFFSLFLFLFPVHFSLTCTWYPAGISFSPLPFFPMLLLLLSGVVVGGEGCCMGRLGGRLGVGGSERGSSFRETPSSSHVESSDWDSRSDCCPSIDFDYSYLHLFFFYFYYDIHYFNQSTGNRNHISSIVRLFHFLF